jgi:putative ABC transport system ATP-binding protein
MTQLEFLDVHHEYEAYGEKVRALNGVSFQLAAGEFVALAGQSGCGKSTLLNLAGAMDLPTRGTVKVAGMETSGMEDAALTRLRREKASFVFQSFQLLPALTAQENVELPMMLARRDGATARALECLRMVGMDSMAARLPHQLSGGQQQRVAIARALTMKPALILADEPTGNLDSATGRSILELLRDLCQREGASILMATHNMESLEYTNRVLRMQDGRFVA